jgi:hypothetical protein
MPDQHSENEYYDVYCPERIDDACQRKVSRRSTPANLASATRCLPERRSGATVIPARTLICTEAHDIARLRNADSD